MSNAVAKSRSRLITVLGVVAIAFAAYWETFVSMFEVWVSSNTYLHGILILPLSAYLVWRGRETWMDIDFRPSALGWMLLVVSVMAWLLGSLVSVQVISQFAFIGVLISIVWSILGTEMVRAIRFPLLFGLFAVPFGEFLIPKLMDWTADATVLALRVTGIPVLKEGTFFSLPSGNFRVVEACSGVRFLIVTFVLSVFFVHENFRSWKKQTIFLIAALTAIVLANWIRAYVVVLIAHFSNLKYGTGEDHVYIGLLIFVVVIVGLFWAGRKYQDVFDADLTSRPRRSADSRRSQNPGAISYTAFSTVLVIATLIAGPVVDAAAQSGPALRIETRLPVLAGSWAGPKKETFGFEPAFSGAVDSVAGQYIRGEERVEVFFYLYANEDQGSELIGWRSRLLPEERWSDYSNATVKVQVSDSKAIPVNEFVVSDGHQRLVIWSWYDIAGTQIADPRLAKLRQAWSLLTSDRVGDAVVVVIAPEHEFSGRSATRNLRSFVAENWQAIGGCLRHDEQQSGRACASRVP